MGLSAEVDTFAGRTTTGNQTVTLADAALTPKVILLWATIQLADGRTTTNFMQFGMWADDSNAQAVAVGRDNDNQTTMTTFYNFDGTKIVVGAGATTHAATISSVAAGSFVLNWTAVSGAALLFNYLVLGGTDITNVDINVIATPTAPSTVSYNIGFQPNCAIGIASVASANPQSGSNLLMSVGVSDGTTQTALGWASRDGVADANTQCRYGSGRFIDLLNLDAAFITGSIAFDSDGYDINYTVVDGTARYLAVLAIKGIRATVVDTLSPTGTGTQNVTGAPGQPVAALLLTAGNDNTNIPNNIAASIGAGAGASQQATCGVTSTDGAATSVTDRSQEQDQVIQMLAQNGATPTEEAAWAGVTATGFDLSWGIATATQRKFGALMFIPNTRPHLFARRQSQIIGGGVL